MAHDHFMDWDSKVGVESMKSTRYGFVGGQKFFFHFGGRTYLTIRLCLGGGG